MRADDDADLLHLIQRPAWHRDAACKEHPELTSFPGRDDVRPAKAVCAHYLVREECRGRVRRAA